MCLQEMPDRCGQLSLLWWMYNPRFRWIEWRQSRPWCLQRSHRMTLGIQNVWLRPLRVVQWFIFSWSLEGNSFTADEKALKRRAWKVALNWVGGKKVLLVYNLVISSTTVVGDDDFSCCRVRRASLMASDSSKDPWLEVKKLLDDDSDWLSLSSQGASTSGTPRSWLSESVADGVVSPKLLLLESFDHWSLTRI